MEKPINLMDYDRLTRVLIMILVKAGTPIKEAVKIICG